MQPSLQSETGNITTSQDIETTEALPDAKRNIQQRLKQEEPDDDDDYPDTTTSTPDDDDTEEDASARNTEWPNRHTLFYFQCIWLKLLLVLGLVTSAFTFLKLNRVIIQGKAT